jgi:chorismate--pyruvate lyase
MTPDLNPMRWQARLPESAAGYRPWLLDRGSLTRRIQKRCPAFSVRQVRQRSTRTGSAGGGLEGLKPRARALLREVYLCCGETPVVYAFSVLPLASLHGAWQGLGKLGNKPLGDTLFGDPRVRRAPLRFKKINRRHELYRRAGGRPGGAPTHLWARRSLFLLHRRPILVTEVFLPGILELRP